MKCLARGEALCPARPRTCSELESKLKQAKAERGQPGHPQWYSFGPQEQERWNCSSHIVWNGPPSGPDSTSAGLSQSEAPLRYRIVFHRSHQRRLRISSLLYLSSFRFGRDRSRSCSRNCGLLSREHRTAHTRLQISYSSMLLLLFVGSELIWGAP